MQFEKGYQKTLGGERLPFVGSRERKSSLTGRAFFIFPAEAKGLRGMPFYYPVIRKGKKRGIITHGKGGKPLSREVGWSKRKK